MLAMIAMEVYNTEMSTFSAITDTEVSSKTVESV
jgi:hypothetical protein